MNDGEHDSEYPQPRPSIGAPAFPADAELALIAQWKVPPYEPLMAFVRERWVYLTLWDEHEAQDELWPDRKVRRYAISTGGFSGNENLVNALRCNAAFWHACWVQSRRGGHYLFEVAAVVEEPVQP